MVDQPCANGVASVLQNTFTFTASLCDQGLTGSTIGVHPDVDREHHIGRTPWPMPKRIGALYSIMHMHMPHVKQDSRLHSQIRLLVWLLL